MPRWPAWSSCSRRAWPTREGDCTALVPGGRADALSLAGDQTRKFRFDPGGTLLQDIPGVPSPDQACRHSRWKGFAVAARRSTCVDRGRVLHAGILRGGNLDQGRRHLPPISRFTTTVLDGTTDLATIAERSGQELRRGGRDHSRASERTGAHGTPPPVPRAKRRDPAAFRGRTRGRCGWPKRSSAPKGKARVALKVVRDRIAPNSCSADSSSIPWSCCAGQKEA